MRRGVTVLVVVVVAAIALAAGIDALRGGGSPEAGSGPERETRSVSTSEPDGWTNYVPLAEDAPAGTLYYTDEACRLRAIELPERTPAPAPSWGECRFVLSPDATSVSGAGTAWDLTGDHLFHARDGRIVVLSSDHEPEGEPFPGTAPAWRPDGTLTYFADGAVRGWPGGDIVLSQRDLVRALRTLPFDELATRFDRFRVREAAWLDGRRLAAILSANGAEGRMDMLAIYDGRELDAFTFDGPGGLSELRTSPRGRYAAARSTGGRDAEFVMIESGRELNTPRIVGYRALAWSPDEQWVAVAAERGVFVYRPGAPGPPELELELDAHDLAWRGEAGPPALADADEAREWLGRVGATGRLFVTVGPWIDCGLRALQLPGLEWAEQPPGPPSPCRFALDDQDGVHPENEVPQPGGGQVAVCRNNAVDVLNDEGFFVGYAGACAPAWTPDGRLTFIRDGGLFQPTGRLLARGELSDLLGRPSALEEIAWVSDERFWAVVRSGESAIVALMTTDRLISSPSFTTQTIEGLRVSASGMVAARTDQGIVFLDTGGRRALTFANGRAVSWAPGEQIAAVATPNEVLFVAPLSGEIVTVPLAVRDLEWVVP